MSFDRPLRGGCQCGRNRYIVQLPQHAAHHHDAPRVLFSSHPAHRASQASPLTAFLRVPLDWYRSCTFAFCPDETSAMIRRVYTSPAEQHAMRQFCGFCGTPLSYFCDHPRSEAEYIQLTLGSLRPEDLGDLEDLGFLSPAESDTEGRGGDSDAEQLPARTAQTSLKSPAHPVASAGASDERTDDDAGNPAAGPSDVLVSTGRDTLGGLPWFDTLMEGSRLGRRVRNSTRLVGSGTGHDGRTVRFEWEVTEWTEGADDEVDSGKKRKLDERDDTPETAMRGVQH